jgi:ATP-binding cassette subfamily F protein 3
MALQEYTGAVVLVSHDRHLLTTVSDRFLLVSDGQVRDFDGDLDDYARWLTSGEAPAQPAPAAATKPVAARPAAPKPDAQQRRRDTAGQRQALAPLKARLTRCEKRLAELATEATRLDTELAAPETYAPGLAKRLQELTTQRARNAQETEAVETEWLQLTDEIERAGQVSD